MFCKSLFFILALSVSELSFAWANLITNPILPEPVVGSGCHQECKSSSEQKGELEVASMQPAVGSNTERETPGLFIFVSLSMPEQSLKLWSEQAQRFGLNLSLRGFVEGSIPKTVEKTSKIIMDAGNGFSIDPEGFRNFDIKQVPAVVLVTQKSGKQEQTSSEDKTPSFEVVYGDTSLLDALEHFARRGSAEAQTLAKWWIKKYREAHGS